jgi:lipopolysaccharide transport system ATP-binding protein
MHPSIKLRGVTLDFPVYSVRAKSLRHAIVSAAVGGSLLRNASDMTFVRAVSNLNLELREGDRLALVGHNGSGKSSLLKLLAGVYEPTAGSLEVAGRVSSMLSLSIGLDHEATGRQNIKNLAMMQMVPSREIARRMSSIIEFSELGTFIDMPFKTYSAGMMARLTFAVGTAISGDILILDEWLSAGDENFQQKANARMTAVASEAKIMVLATHNRQMVLNVCNKVLELESGRCVFLGTTDEWAQRTVD